MTDNKKYCKNCEHYNYGDVEKTYANGIFVENEKVCTHCLNKLKEKRNYQTGELEIIYNRYFSNDGNCENFEYIKYNYAGCLILLIAVIFVFISLKYIG